MSSNLYWQPVVPQEHNSWSTAMKFLLRQHYRLNGSEKITLGKDDIGWFQGVAAATSDDILRNDVNELLQALTEYDSIQVWEQY